jgi:hypothetical protein
MSRKFLEVNPATQLFDPVDGVGVSAGVSDAYKLVLTRGDGTIDPTFLPSSTGGIVPSSAIAGATLTAGMFVSVYLDGVTKKVRPAHGDNTDYPAMGFISADVNIGDPVSYFLVGEHIAIPAGTTYLPTDVNKAVWLSDTTPGAITLVRPTTEGHIAQKLGVIDALVTVDSVLMVKIIVNIQPYTQLSAPGEPSILVPLPDGNFKERSTKSLGFTFEQMTPALNWTINHNLGYKPKAVVIDSAGTEVVGDASYPNDNQVILHFGAAFSGTARLG